MNFRIIENHEDYYAKYESFIEQYNNHDKTIDNIVKDLGISNKKYRNYRERALKENKIKPRRQRGRYYQQTRHGTYIVVKRNPKTNKMQSWGTYSTKEEAEERINELKKVNWIER